MPSAPLPCHVGILCQVDGLEVSSGPARRRCRRCCVAGRNLWSTTPGRGPRSGSSPRWASGLRKAARTRQPRHHPPGRRGTRLVERLTLNPRLAGEPWRGLVLGGPPGHPPRHRSISQGGNAKIRTATTAGTAAVIRASGPRSRRDPNDGKPSDDLERRARVGPGAVSTGRTTACGSMHSLDRVGRGRGSRRRPRDRSAMARAVRR